MKSALYVHIPFCNGKCDYCDFYSLGNGSRKQKQIFVDVLVKQLKKSCEKLQINEFSTVYIGGGTPSSLDPQSLETIFSAVAASSAVPPFEWTVEVNPESLSTEHMDLFSDFPLTRISMGVQSLYEPSREYLGRRGSRKEVFRALTLLRDRWKGDLSLDLIRGLPQHVSLPLDRELSQLPVSEIQHLSLYDLTLEKNTPLAQRADRTAAFREDNLPRSIEELGFLQYEVSNYAVPGKESRHNQSYWDMDPYLGIGPGAVSLVNRQGEWVHQSVRRDLNLYLNGSPDAYTETEIPSMLEFFIEHLIMGFRQVRGLSLKKIQQRFGRDLYKIIPQTLHSWENNLSENTETGRLSLASNGFWIQDRFFLDAWREAESANPFA